MNAKKIRVHVLISGDVQGVFFRHHTRELAKQLGLTGWVRNTEDDKVEAIFEGDKDKIKKILEFCKKGPTLARVNNVKAEEEKFKGEFKDFEIIY
ncbi:MAG: acylphosphatase [Candidatus Aenigmarchaeota archaeon]|nr:acylphosphatase [Candidatus Aenigmarchaeota archaeon]